MIDNQMRQYIDVVQAPRAGVHLDEGIVSNIKNWINSLGDPIKKKGMAHVRDMGEWLKSKYGAKVTAQEKSTNKSWMWSKVTYKDLYQFATHSLGATEEELNRALKNPIVNNNLKQLYNSLPDGVDHPALPLKATTIQNNINPISATIDKQTREYLSKAIASAVLDGLVYIDTLKPTSPAQAANKTVPSNTNSTSAPDSTVSAASSDAPDRIPTSPEDLKSAIQTIKQGIERLKGAA
jgi:hypothetical protein